MTNQPSGASKFPVYHARCHDWLSTINTHLVIAIARTTRRIISAERPPYQIITAVGGYFCAASMARTVACLLVESKSRPHPPSLFSLSSSY